MRRERPLTEVQIVHAMREVSRKRRYVFTEGEFSAQVRKCLAMGVQNVGDVEAQLAFFTQFNKPVTPPKPKPRKPNFSLLPPIPENLKGAYDTILAILNQVAGRGDSAHVSALWPSERKLLALKMAQAEVSDAAGVVEYLENLKSIETKE